MAIATVAQKAATASRISFSLDLINFKFGPFLEASDNCICMTTETVAVATTTTTTSSPQSIVTRIHTLAVVVIVVNGC